MLKCYIASTTRGRRERAWEEITPNQSSPVGEIIRGLHKHTKRGSGGGEGGNVWVLNK